MVTHAHHLVHVMDHLLVVTGGMGLLNGSPLHLFVFLSRIALVLTILPNLFKPDIVKMLSFKKKNYYSSY